MRFLAILLITSCAWASYPPTTTKDSSDSNPVTTFNFQFPNFTGTHTGTTFSLGVNGIAGGGTNEASQTSNGVCYFDGTGLTTGSGITYDGAGTLATSFETLSNTFTATGNALLHATATSAATSGGTFTATGILATASNSSSTTVAGENVTGITSAVSTAATVGTGTLTGTLNTIDNTANALVTNANGV